MLVLFFTNGAMISQCHYRRMEKCCCLANDVQLRGVFAMYGVPY